MELSCSKQQAMEAGRAGEHVAVCEPETLAAIDRLRYRQSDGYQCLWTTLTSSPRSSAKRLRADFQALRKRIGREPGFSCVEYICVDTREERGVLHMI